MSPVSLYYYLYLHLYYQLSILQSAYKEFYKCTGFSQVACQANVANVHLFTFWGSDSTMPPPTTSQNISTTSHHHPPPAKIYPPPPTTTRHQPRYIHQHPPTPTNSQNLFYKKPIYKNLYPLSGGNVKNLNIKPAITLSFLFTTYTKNGFKKLQCERTFIL